MALSPFSNIVEQTDQEFSVILMAVERSLKIQFPTLVAFGVDDTFLT